MTTITKEHINGLYDACAMMRLFSQVMNEGEIDDRKASEMSWLLGTAKLRLEPLLDVVEQIQKMEAQQ